jgi:hypothetical protein
VTVAELIAVLQKLDPGATVVAPFSPNASEINVEELGGVFVRQKLPFAGAIELTRARRDYTNAEEVSAKTQHSCCVLSALYQALRYRSIISFADGTMGLFCGLPEASASSAILPRQDSNSL